MFKSDSCWFKFTSRVIFSLFSFRFVSRIAENCFQSIALRTVRTASWTTFTLNSMPFYLYGVLQLELTFTSLHLKEENELP